MPPDSENRRGSLRKVRQRPRWPGVGRFRFEVATACFLCRGPVLAGTVAIKPTASRQAGPWLLLVPPPQRRQPGQAASEQEQRGGFRDGVRCKVG